MNITDFKSNYKWDYSTNFLAQCECYSDNCITKRIRFYNPIHGGLVEYKICREIITQFFDNVDDYSYCDEQVRRSYLYSDLLKNIIVEYYMVVHNLNVTERNYGYSKNLSNEIVMFEVCYKPYVRVGILIPQVFEIILQGDFLINKYNIVPNLIDALKYFFERNDYKYNKTLKKEVFALLKGITDFKINENIDIKTLTILEKLYKITINNK